MELDKVHGVCISKFIYKLKKDEMNLLTKQELDRLNETASIAFGWANTTSSQLVYIDTLMTMFPGFQLTIEMEQTPLLCDLEKLISMWRSKYRFYLDQGRWFIDLPGWTGDKYDLEMVAGADDMLATLAQGESELWIKLQEEPWGDNVGFRAELFDIHGTRGGGTYRLFGKGKNTESSIDYMYDIWLCDVTRQLFGYLPETLYFYKL